MSKKEPFCHPFNNLRPNSARNLLPTDLTLAAKSLQNWASTATVVATGRTSPSPRDEGRCQLATSPRSKDTTRWDKKLQILTTVI